MAAASEVSYEEQLRMLEEERGEPMNQKAVRDSKAANGLLKSELAGVTIGATSGSTKVIENWEMVRVVGHTEWDKTVSRANSDSDVGDSPTD